MTGLKEDIAKCPKCGEQQLSVLETIEAWQWERPVYGCAACEMSFMGSWRSTEEHIAPPVDAPIEAIARAL